MWRFLAFADPLVSLALSRDVDSWLSERERAAVTQWRSTDALFHAMRDLPQHNTYILAGGGIILRIFIEEKM